MYASTLSSLSGNGSDEKAVVFLDLCGAEEASSVVLGVVAFFSSFCFFFLLRFDPLWFNAVLGCPRVLELLLDLLPDPAFVFSFDFLPPTRPDSQQISISQKKEALLKF